MLEDFVRVFCAVKPDRAIVEAAHMELAEPSIETAVQRCVERGATRIVLAPYFLAPGKHWHKDLPQLTEAACKPLGVSWLVAQPIGLHEAMADIIDDRVTHCLARTEGKADECDACRGTGRCQFVS